MRKLLLTLVAISGMAIPAFSYDLPYLAFRDASGNITTIDAQDLELTFADGVITATNGSETLTLTAAEIEAMYFTSTPSAVASVAVDTEGSLEVYTTAGISLGKFSSLEAARKAVGEGIFVVKQNEKTFKIAIK
jgi:hypothetical protein